MKGKIIVVKIINTVCSKDCFGTCPLRVHLENNRVTKVEGGYNSVFDGKICVKGINFIKRLYHPDRILYPLKRIGKRGSSRFKKITWDEAIDTIHQKLSKIKEELGPEAVLYHQGSGNFGAMNKYPLGFWYQFGGYTRLSGGLCDPAGNEAIKYTFGDIKHNALSDIQNSKLIILWGSNPANTNVHKMRYINKAIKNGAKLVTIDPRVSESSKKSFLHISPRCGTDGLLALGIAKIIYEKNIYDKDFVSKYTFGFEEYTKLLQKYTIEYISKITEVSISDIEKLANIIKDNPVYTLSLGSGLQRYTNGGQSVRSISILPVLTGNIGKKGGGLYFVYKETFDLEWPYIPPKPDRIRNTIPAGRLASELDIQKNPPIRVAWIEKANPMVSHPNTNKLKEAMFKLDFIVVLDQFITDTAALADIVLPVATMLEQNDIVTSYGHPYIQLQQRVIEPLGESKVDKDIYLLLGEKFNFDVDYLPENDNEILSEVIRTNNLKTSIEELSQKPYLFEEYDKIAYEDFIFPTETGKIEIYSELIHKDWGVNPLPDFTDIDESMISSPDKFKRYPLHFISPHAAERINSQFTELNLAAYDNEPSLQINIKDAKKRNINHGDIVKIYNDRGFIQAKADIGEKIKPGTVSVYSGWNEKFKASVNKLTSDKTTDIAHGTSFHSCLVEVERI